MSRRQPLVVVTGPTGRLGSAACRELARRDARLVLVGPEAERLDALAEELEAERAASVASTHVADLSLLTSTARLGDDLAERHARVDAVVHVAEVRGPPVRTLEDLPDLVVVNYLAPWLLAQRLLPSLGDGAAVVTLGPPPGTAPTPIAVPEDLLGTRAAVPRGDPYTCTKLFAAMFATELPRRRAAAGLRATWVPTPPGPGALRMMTDLVDPRSWAYRAPDPTAVLLADAALPGPATPDEETCALPAPADDAFLQRRLWEITDALVAGVTAPTGACS